MMARIWQIKWEHLLLRDTTTKLAIFRFSLFFVGLMTFSASLHAQEKWRDLPLLGFPVGGYTPETGWGIGAAASYHFRVNADSLTPISQVQLGFVVTQKNQQIFSLPFNVYSAQRKHQYYGEATYSNYHYYFFGTVRYPQDVKEKYHSRYSRVRMNYLHKIHSHVFLGARWWFEELQFKDRAANGKLIEGKLSGAIGGVSSGPGLILLVDSRDHLYYSTKGHYFEGVAQTHSSITGSDFFYERLRADYRFFSPINSKWTFATQLFADLTWGNTPFFMMPGIGGEKRMRGYYEGEVRDEQLLLAQAEFRYRPIDRWAFTGFAHSAMVGFNLLHGANRTQKWAAGAGVRYFFDKKNRMTIRLDAAYNGKNILPYLSVGEAF
ncbi:MAG: BamA/TamA family outer membrane protein [Flavobacteriales bacterium]